MAFRINAETLQILNQPVSRPDAVAGIGGVGRDAFDTQEFKQSIQRLLAVGIYPVEYRLQR